MGPAVLRVERDVTDGEMQVSHSLPTGAAGVPQFQPDPYEQDVVVTSDGKHLVVSSERDSSLLVFGVSTCP